MDKSNEGREYQMPPQESGRLREAQQKYEQAVAAANQIGFTFVMYLADSIQKVHDLQMAQTEVQYAMDRAVKESTIHKELVQGFDMERGTIKYGKREEEQVNPIVTARS